MAVFRDEAHVALCEEDNKPVGDRVWINVRRWFENSSGPSQSLSERVNVQFQDLGKPYVSQIFRYIQHLKPWVEDDGVVDRRVWDIVSQWQFGGQQLQCDLLRISSDNVTQSGSTGNGFWSVKVATPFEKIVFLFLLIRLSGCENSSAEGERPKKKARKMRIAPSYKRNRAASQRLGHAVQVVVRAWDMLARSLRFGTAYEMLFPYILFDIREGSFRALPSRADGYAPSTHSRSFRLGDRTNADTPSAITGRTDGVDSGLRLLASHFVSDMKSKVANEALFAQADEHWEGGSPFSIVDGAIPGRFRILTPSVDRLKGALGVEDMEQAGIGVSGDGPGHRALSDANDSVPLLASQSSTPVQVGSGNPILRGECPANCACVDARKSVVTFMQRWVRMWHCCFRELVDTDTGSRPNGVPNITGNVQLVLTDPPFNIRRELGRDVSEYDVLTVDDMYDTVECINSLLRPGGHVVIFCSAEQFAQWVACFEDQKETGDAGKETTMYRVDKNDIVIVNSPGTYHSFAHRMSTTPVTVTQKCFHAVRLGATRREEVNMVRYNNFGYIPTRHPGFVNVIDNVPKLGNGEMLMYPAGEGNRSSRVRAEQKPSVLLQELIARFSLPGDIVVDLFGGTFSAAAACITMGDGEMRTFVGCERESRCFVTASRRVENMFASHVMDIAAYDTSRESIRRRPTKLDLLTPSHVLEAARLVVSHCGTGREGHRRSWEAPKGLPPVSIIPPYLMGFASHAMRNRRLATTLRQVPFIKWPVPVQASFHTLHMETLLSVEAQARGVYVAKSRIRHPRAGDGLFAGRQFGKGDVIGFYYGTIVYENIGDTPSRGYGHGCFRTNGELFAKYSMEVIVSPRCTYDGKDGKPERVRQAYIVPLPCCVCSKINDARYVPGDLDRGEDRMTRKPNVVFRQQPDPVERCKDLDSYDLIRVVATRHIVEEEEFYVDYGTNYNL